jgi:predicted O-methyltransferase YrrM
MIFIDGGHSKKAAETDYRLWSTKLINGGLLAIHDVFPNPDDGGRPPFEIYCQALESNNFEKIDLIGSLALLRKIN